jgi:hypothetical protein
LLHIERGRERERERENMTKTLKFVLTIILFFSLFLTTKAAYPYDYSVVWTCETDQDCNDDQNLTPKDVESLNARGKKMICKHNRCYVIAFSLEVDKLHM